MKTSTPRAPRRFQPITVRTVDLCDQRAPESYVNLGYGMSRPDPLQDPCGYAATVSGPYNFGKPAQRIAKPLAPTADETEAMIASRGHFSSSRTVEGDAVHKLAQKNDSEALKLDMKIGDVRAVEYEQVKQEQVVSAAQSRVASTPLRRMHEGSQGSASKRQRTAIHFTPNGAESSNSSMVFKTPADGDVSLDTVRSVLRLVDESLISTPQRTSVATPRVLRAQPVPSPRERGPAFAYNSNAQLDKFGGLANRQISVMPFGFARV